MAKQWIKNRSQLAITAARERVLDIVQAGLDAIDTETVISANMSLDGQTLKIQDKTFPLAEVKNIYVIGFGKAACQAAFALENILGNRIKKGLAIGLAPVACEYIQTFGGTHPYPSPGNVELSQKVFDLSTTLTDADLVITIVSGGGSALLCWPMGECRQASRLYDDFLKTGGDIKELNTIRKHISGLKGGGLAKTLYPAQVIGLIFSDVPGDDFQYVASGPTYKDTSTLSQAQTVLDKYNLQGYHLTETPKDDRYFVKVTNIPMVSNQHALIAMGEKAQDLGLAAKILSAELYADTEYVANEFVTAARAGCVILGAGEPKVVVSSQDGSGGRCQRLGLTILNQLGPQDVFAAIASDGLDNSDAAGVIVDASTLSRAKSLDLKPEKFKQKFDHYNFFAPLSHELLFTGPTGANVSDFMILYRP